MNINKTMTLQQALDELEILEIELTNVDKEYIKKKYHKLALKWHPDKNKSDRAKEKFQNINDAYEFITNEINNNYSKTSEEFVSSFDFKESTIYINILNEFISSLITGSYNEVFFNIIKDISLEYDSITLHYLRSKFEILEKQKAIELYQILYKYKDILYINDTTLNFVSLIIKEKFKNDRIYILNTNLKDIIEHNIYKLYIDEQLYLVPSWHNELYFDSNDGTEIIVLCQPLLPTNISIDENNNLYVEKTINMTTELHYLLKHVGFVSIEIGEKWFSIPLNHLHLKEEQLYILKKQGISSISEKDIYNINKSDIIVKIKMI